MNNPFPCFWCYFLRCNPFHTSFKYLFSGVAVVFFYYFSHFNPFCPSFSPYLALTLLFQILATGKQLGRRLQHICSHLPSRSLSCDEICAEETFFPRELPRIFSHNSGFDFWIECREQFSYFLLDFSAYEYGQEIDKRFLPLHLNRYTALQDLAFHLHSSHVRTALTIFKSYFLYVWLQLKYIFHTRYVHKLATQLVTRCISPHSVMFYGGSACGFRFSITQMCCRNECSFIFF